MAATPSSLDRTDDGSLRVTRTAGIDENRGQVAESEIRLPDP
jgi:hypothetical protein